jgi:hypothetical protein
MGLSLVVAAFLLAAACDPEPEPPPPPPPPSGYVIVYGDSLISEALGELEARFPEFMPNRLLLIRHMGGTAQCDFNDDMVEDANSLEVVAVVIAFSGNNLTPCIQSRPFESAYAADADWAAEFWQGRGVPVVFVESLGALGTALSDYVIGSTYATVAALHGETLADTTPYFARGEPLTYSGWMPCLEGECFGSVQVRRADGHLCHEPTAGLPCPEYSSGVMRYVDVIWRATAQRLGYPVPVRRGPETGIFATH